jgi:threonine/homoserine/homoserine lactone efflux protein
VLNPKVALFFLAFVPQFITPDMREQAAGVPAAGPAVQLQRSVGQLRLGLAAAWMAKRVVRVQRGMHWLERGAGAMFIGFGLKLAFPTIRRPDHPGQT